MATESITGQIDNVVISQFESLLRGLGKGSLNALYPNDFEYYLTALELVDSREVTREYFIFPVNPSSMNDVDSPIKNISVTAGGVVVHKRKGFNPRDIQLSGTFGRKFKYLIGRDVAVFTGLSFQNTEAEELGSLNNRLFSETVKTGYGCTKILERILLRADTLDSYGKPYALYYYNFASGNNYLVSRTQFQMSMDLSNNMMWKYNVSFKALARTETLQNRSTKSMYKLLIFQGVQKKVNKVANNIASIIKNNAD